MTSRIEERELVFDHADLFVRKKWHGSLTVEDWCGKVMGLPSEDQSDYVSGRDLGMS